MKRKLIAIDLDGTTLNNRSQIDPYTEVIFQKVLQQGHMICIVTGRSFRNSQRYYKQLQLDSPIVNFNGAVCHLPKNPDWEAGYTCTLTKDLALNMLQMDDFEHVQMIAAETFKHVYMNRSFVPYPDFFDAKRETARPFTRDAFDENPISVSIFTQNDHTHGLIKEKILEVVDTDVEVRTWGGFAPCLELVQAGVQKAMGVERIAHTFGFSRKDIIALGDEDNDYEMIQYAGLGVAMANAIPAIKKIANDQTLYTNEEQGVARYLSDYFDL